MRTHSPQICPLCGTPAYYEAEDHGNLKHFHCDNCVEFVISTQAEVELMAATLEAARLLSRRAKAARDGEYLCITVPLRERHEGIASPVLDVQFVERGSQER